MLTGDKNPENRAKFRPLFLEVAQELQRREAVLFPGAPELLRALKARGMKTAIVSTKKGDTLEIIMDRYGLLSDLETVIGSADVHRPKPDPEGLLLALERMGVKPQDALFCGDTILDAGAAQNAGCHFAAVLNGTTPAGDFQEFHPDYIASDLFDLRTWLGV